MEYLRNLIRRVKRVIEYLPILWESDDYDYAYSLVIYTYSLKRLRKYLNTSKVYDFPKKDDRRLAKYIKTLERLTDGNYFEQAPYPKVDENSFRFEGSKEEVSKLLEERRKKVIELRKKDCQTVATMIELYMTRWWD